MYDGERQLAGHSGYAGSSAVGTGVPCTGRLAGSDERGEILVECHGNKPVTARLVKGLSRFELGREENRGREVLLVFDGGNPEKPIILALMTDPLEDSILMEIIGLDRAEPKEARVDGNRVTIEAENEIVLKCGSGSITIRKDGKIVIKGTHLVSRSSGPHRIKGARVDIN